MTAPVPTDQGQTDHNCQDPTCGNTFDVIMFKVGDSQANWLCWEHFIPFVLAVVQAVMADAAAAEAEAAAGEVAEPAAAGA